MEITRVARDDTDSRKASSRGLLANRTSSRGLSAGSSAYSCHPERSEGSPAYREITRVARDDIGSRGQAAGRRISRGIYQTTCVAHALLE